MIDLQAFKGQILAAKDIAASSRYLETRKHVNFPKKVQTMNDLEYAQFITRKHKLFFKELEGKMTVDGAKLRQADLAWAGHVSHFYFGCDLDLTSSPFFGTLGLQNDSLSIKDFLVSAHYDDLSKLDPERKKQVVSKLTNLPVVRISKGNLGEFKSNAQYFPQNNDDKFFNVSEGLNLGDFLSFDEKGEVTLPREKIFRATLATNAESMFDEHMIRRLSPKLGYSGELSSKLAELMRTGKSSALDLIVAHQLAQRDPEILQDRFNVEVGPINDIAHSLVSWPHLTLKNTGKGNYSVSAHLEVRADNYFAKFALGYHRAEETLNLADQFVV